MTFPSKTHAIVAIKVIHTVIWALLAGCILAIPVAAWSHRFLWALALSAIILTECGILALNRGRCPLTHVAARFTDERADNFDIYLPNWLAHNNKVIFGSLFLADEAVLLIFWFIGR